VGVAHQAPLLVELVALGVVGVGGELLQGEAGALHAERVEERRLHQLLPGGAGDAAAQQAGRHVHQVVVLERRAQVAAEGQVLEAPVQLLARERRAEPEAVVARQADAVGDEVARGRAQRRHVVVQPEVRQVVAHRLVPVELALADERAQSAHRELLGDGRDRHQGVRRHRQVSSRGRAGRSP
jgi:hypothetical protein